MKMKFAELTTFIFWFMLLSSQFLSAAEAENGAEGLAQGSKEKGKPSLAEIGTDAISIIKSPHKISWDKVKTLLNKLQLRLSPPNLEGSTNKVNTVEEVKDAVGKSFGSSKSSVEDTAKTAADAVHKTAEKVKETISDQEESKAEL